MDLPAQIDWQTMFGFLALAFFMFIMFVFAIAMSYIDEIIRDLQLNLFNIRHFYVVKQNVYGDFNFKYIPRKNLVNNELQISKNEIIKVNPIKDIYRIDGEWYIFVGFDEIEPRKLVNEETLLDANYIKYKRIFTISDQKILIEKMKSGIEYKITPNIFHEHLNAHMVKDVIMANKNNDNDIIQYIIIAIVAITAGVVIYAIAKSHGWI